MAPLSLSIRRSAASKSSARYQRGTAPVFEVCVRLKCRGDCDVFRPGFINANQNVADSLSKYVLTAFERKVHARQIHTRAHAAGSSMHFRRHRLPPLHGEPLAPTWQTVYPYIAPNSTIGHGKPRPTHTRMELAHLVLFFLLYNGTPQPKIVGIPFLFYNLTFLYTQTIGFVIRLHLDFSSSQYLGGI